MNLPTLRAFGLPVTTPFDVRRVAVKLGTMHFREWLGADEKPDQQVGELTSMAFKWSLIFLFFSPSIASAQTASATPSDAGPRHVCNIDFDVGGVPTPTVVHFTITAEGTVKDVTIVKSSELPLVNGETLLCVSKWLYHPALKDGAPVESEWTAKVEWRAAGNH